MTALTATHLVVAFLGSIAVLGFGAFVASLLERWERHRNRNRYVDTQPSAKVIRAYMKAVRGLR